MLVRQQSVESFLSFASHAGYLAGIGHRTAALEDSRLLPLSTVETALSTTPKKDEVVARLAALEGSLRERGVKSLAVFGSVARGAARSDSDVDVLVDIEADARFSLIDLAALKDFLEEHLGHRVDVVTKVGLESDIRNRVLSEAENVF